MPEAKLKVLVLWSPIRAQDNKSSATRASAYLADPRVEHFWDLWSFGVKTYTKQLKYPQGEVAWDIFLLYKERLKWEKGPPEPTVWLQNRQLSHGTKYSQDLLAEELGRLLRK